MVRRYRYRILATVLALFATPACDTLLNLLPTPEITEGWILVGAGDIEQTRLLRAATCGETPEVGLYVYENELSDENRAVIDGLAVMRHEGHTRITRPDAPVLASIFRMTGLSVWIEVKTWQALPPLLAPEFTEAEKPVAVILDLPLQDFSEHLAQLSGALSADAGADLRVVETTGQVMATLSPEGLRRLEALASICTVYADAMLTPLD